MTMGAVARAVVNYEGAHINRVFELGLGNRLFAGGRISGVKMLCGERIIDVLRAHADTPGRTACARD